ncbi:MAG: hypothetical protein U5L07_19505 [Desulfobacterales bacterium]|nr:hypothetical protein [Desulfobacterales bacterium]
MEYSREIALGAGEAYVYDFEATQDGGQAAPLPRPMVDGNLWKRSPVDKRDKSK